MTFLSERPATLCRAMAAIVFAALAAAPPTAAQGKTGNVLSWQKISQTQGGFTGTLGTDAFFGTSIAFMGRPDASGEYMLAVGAEAGQGSVSYGNVWILDVRANGTVRSQTQIGQGLGGFGFGLSGVARFGSAVAWLGELGPDLERVLVVGSRFQKAAGLFKAGAVWLLFLAPDGTVRGWRMVSESAGGFTGPLGTNHRFGTEVEVLGDLDGDGVIDLAVGAPGDDGLGPSTGAVWILFMNADGTVKSDTRIAPGASGFTGGVEPLDLFGRGLAWLGPMDADGVGVLAVGAPGDDDEDKDSGAVWLLSLAADGTVVASRKISDLFGGFKGTLLPGDGFGHELAALGDLNADGVADLAVGAPNGGGQFVPTGATWILFLAPDGTVVTHRKITASTAGFTGVLEGGDLFGKSLAAAGDLDDDGRLDLLVGAAGDDDGGTPTWADPGAVWQLFLNAGRWVDLGGALAGAGGAPALGGLGPLAGKTLATLQLDGAAPGAPVTLVIGFATIDAPFHGGVMIPRPDVLAGGLATDGAGSMTAQGKWPTGMPMHTDVYFQAWIADATGPSGLTASNALAATTP